MCKDVEQRGAKVRRQGTELRELQHPLRLRSAVVGEQVKPDIFLQEGHIPLDVGRQELWIPSKLRRMPAHSRPMVGPWMLCVKGWSLSGRYHGWPMDALRERMRSGWTLSWLAHGCSA